MKTPVRFEERTGYAWWVHGLMVFVVLAVVGPILVGFGLIPGKEGSSPDMGGAILALSLGLGIPVFFYGIVGELRTRITDSDIGLAWGASEIIRRTIPFHEIRSVKAVTYSPLMEFGGWGIRWGRKGRKAWTTRGNRALCLELADGTTFYIGSDRPERLVPWIRLGREKEEES